ncbi:MAG: hypothetical protein MK135_02270 [Polyangiaceae bacterium]|nr:hypothetical protein [Polyangiaceae bacterium]
MSNYQIGPETFVTVRAHVFDEEGEAACEPEILAFVFGLGSLFPELEQELEGKYAGEKVECKLRPEQSWGQRRSEGILRVERGEFPDDVSVGDRFEVENLEGGLLVFHILEVSEEEVVVDTNHPLAEQQIQVSVDILEVRPATEEELAVAEETMLGELGESSTNAGNDTIKPSELIRFKDSR